MKGQLPASVSIGAQILKRYAIGESLAARFKSIIQPAHLRAGCWMCGNEDEEFRAAVGGLMLSYETNSSEQERVATEMRQLQLFSTIVQAAQQGLSVSQIPDVPEGFEPIGLMQLWRERER